MQVYNDDTTLSGTTSWRSMISYIDRPGKPSQELGEDSWTNSAPETENFGCHLCLLPFRFDIARCDRGMSRRGNNRPPPLVALWISARDQSECFIAHLPRQQFRA
jgi:hypothetical protein